MQVRAVVHGIRWNGVNMRLGLKLGVSMLILVEGERADV